MSERNTSIGNPNTGLTKTQARRPKTGVAAPDVAARLPEKSPRIAPQRDPFNILAAFDRLSKLLTRDTEGQPKAGVPPRGYYLNILV